jgi:hypothetical protein
MAKDWMAHAVRSVDADPMVSEAVHDLEVAILNGKHQRGVSILGQVSSCRSLRKRAGWLGGWVGRVT